MTAEILAATEHLVLRRITNDAAAALAAYRSDPVQARYQSWETPYRLSALYRFTRAVIFAGSASPFSSSRSSSGQSS
jgi:RimJ/RimL family protein N-acetyltransferase